jgi:branched-subunit amino acid transport protein
MGAWEAVVAIQGLGLITVVTPAFFRRPSASCRFGVAARGLSHAPAALVAVIVPEVIMSNGHLIQTWQDARLYAAAAGGLWYWWRRGILGTIVCGTAVLLALRFGLGW